MCNVEYSVESKESVDRKVRIAIQTKQSRIVASINLTARRQMFISSNGIIDAKRPLWRLYSL